jgi:hypothetical protein
MSTSEPSLSGPTEKLAFTEPYLSASGAISSFAPLKAIKTHFCAFHCYATDRTRHVESHQYVAPPRLLLKQKKDRKSGEEDKKRLM